MLRSAISAICATLSLVLLTPSAKAAPAPLSGPAVFGSAALSITKTPYDAKWKSLQWNSIGVGASIAAAARKKDGFERLQYVNRAINAAIAYRVDGAGRSGADNWASAAESFARRAGDCEDYAIAKMQVLLATGIPASDLFLVIGKDHAAGADHAVLIVRSAGTYWVLDNFNDRVHQDTQFRHFTPVMSLSLRGGWLHGHNLADSKVDAHPGSGNRASLSNSNLAAIIAMQTN